MELLYLYMSYTVLTIAACSVAIVAFNFSTGSTSKQLALIGELRITVERARKSCEKAQSAALWTAGDSGRCVGMRNLVSFPPEPHENDFVEQANQIFQTLVFVTAATTDLRVSSLRRQIAEIRRVEADCHALLAALEVTKKPIPIEAILETHSAGRFQRLVALQ